MKESIDKSKGKKEISDNLLWARNNDSIVSHVLDSGGDATDCVIALLHQKKILIERLMKLEMISPRKVKIGDQIFIWRCPDELIP